MSQVNELCFVSQVKSQGKGIFCVTGKGIRFSVTRKGIVLSVTRKGMTFSVIRNCIFCHM